MATTFTPSQAPLGSAPAPSAWTGEAGAERSAGELAGAISSEIVALMRKHTGRGPTRAKTTISSELVVVVLADCLTTADRHLAAQGHGELVGRARDEIHRGMRAKATSIVEELTHRTVTAYLTDQHSDPDIAIIAFFLGRPARQAA